LPTPFPGGSSRAITATPSRRSARHSTTPDGAAVLDEDSLAKTMRRKATVNLDSAGNGSFSKSFLSFSTPIISAKLNSIGVLLGNSLDVIAISTMDLKHMESDRLKCNSIVSSKLNTSVIDDDEEEAYAISDGQLLSHIVGEVSKVGLDETMLGSCYEPKTSDQNPDRHLVKEMQG
jgi:hypothetical protein